MPTQKILLTLIHGTWAKNADWTKPDSPFVTGIRKALPPEVEIVTERIPWSGSNSGRARSAAMVHVVDHIRQCAKKWPEHTHYLIGHSHGGGIAVNAGIANGPAVAGVACLSTPFIHNWLRGGTLFHKLLIGVIFWLVLGLVVAFGSTPGPFLLIGGVILTAVLAKVTERPVRSYLQPILLNPDPHFFTMRPNAKMNLLLVRVAGDEASGGLALARLAQWLSATIERAVTETDLLPLLFVVAGALLFTPMMLWASGVLPWWALMLVGAGVAGSILWWGFEEAVFGVAQSATYPLAIFFIVPMMLISIGFGWDAPLNILSCEMSVEETPPGKWTVHQMSHMYLTGEVFEHSTAMMNPEVWKLLADWMQEKIADPADPIVAPGVSA